MMQRLEAILRCPISHAPLERLPAPARDALNERISRGDLVHVSGAPVTKAIGDALASPGGQYVYPIIDGIVIALAELAIAPAGVQGASGLRGSKEEVRRFYEEVGWLRGEETGAFVDAERFEDLRDVTGDYIRRCHLRVNRYLAPAGDFLLDVASGPVQYDEYLTYSQGYGKRLCIDISFRALEKAKERLGDRGAYVLGDITNLPLRDGTVDGAVSLHTIFHVPRDEQHLALKELHRVLRPGRSAVVVYSWGGHSLAMKFALSPLRLLALPYYGARRLLRTLRPRPNADAATAEPRLYFFAHPPDYFWRARWPFRLRLRVWRSVSVEFTRTFAHDGFCGRALLAALFWLEERAPRAAGLVGQYPLLWIVKEGAGAISATARGTLAAPR